MHTHAYNSFRRVTRCQSLLVFCEGEQGPRFTSTCHGQKASDLYFCHLLRHLWTLPGVMCGQIKKLHKLGMVIVFN